MPVPIEIDIRGHKIVALSFNEEKDGIPVIFIHGVTASINFWEPIQLPIIKDKVRWYSLSLPGHHPATFPDEFEVGSFNRGMITEVLSDAIRKLVGKEVVILIGYSTGGFAALDIAASLPDMVAGVISISGFSSGKWNGALGLLQKVARSGSLSSLLFKTNLRSLVAKRFIYLMAAGFYVKDKKALYSYPGFEANFDLIYRDAKKLEASSLFPYFNRLPDIDISERLQLISVPTLAVAGECDPIVPPEQSRDIAARVKEGELHILEGVGHLPMFEKPKEYNSVIEKWIKRNI